MLDAITNPKMCIGSDDIDVLHTRNPIGCPDQWYLSSVG